MTKEKLNKYWFKVVIATALVAFCVNQFSGCLTTKANAIITSPEKLIELEKRYDSMQQSFDKEMFTVQLKQKETEARLKNIEESLLRNELKTMSLHEVVVKMESQNNRIIEILLTK